MKEIKLTKGYRAMVDDDDYEWLSKYKWSSNIRPCGKLIYAVTTIQRKSISMHRLIMKSEKGEYTDHIDNDTLNNQKHNLRKCMHRENIRNSTLRRDSKSGYRGVCWHKRAKKWSSQITVNYKKIHLGLYESSFVAAMVYDEAARKYFGEFANTNF